MLQSVLSSVAIKKPFDILFLQEWQPVAILVIHNNFFFLFTIMVLIVSGHTISK